MSRGHPIEEIGSESKAIFNLSQRDDAKWNNIGIKVKELGKAFQSEELTTWLCKKETFTSEMECLKRADLSQKYQSI